MRSRNFQNSSHQGWKEFADIGLLWWTNRILHSFGWAIVLTEENDGTITKAEPRRVSYFGFSPDLDEAGLRKFRAHNVKDGK